MVLGRKEIPFQIPPSVVSNSHFVARCVNEIWQRIWHRDVNAGRNMILLALYLLYQIDRPELFSTSLPEPPVVHDDDAEDNDEDNNTFPFPQE